MTKKLSRFPRTITDQSYCGQRFSDTAFYSWSNSDTYGRSFPSHSTRSASKPQSGALFALARQNRFSPPPQTCCSNQASVLISYLTYLSDKQRTKGTFRGSHAASDALTT